MKMIIFNCPAYKGLTRDIPDWLDNTNCGHYAGQVPCQDCIDCVVKRIYEMCKEDLKPVREWQEGDTIFIEYKKDVHLARDILQLLDIQEVE